MRLHIVIALLTTCRLSVGADNFDELIHKGRAAYNAADISTASQFYNKACMADAMKLYPPDRVAYCHHQLATVSSATGEIAETERQYLLAIEAWKAAGPKYSPSRCVSLMNLGELYRRRHRLSEAEQMLSQAVAEAANAEKSDPELRPESLSRLGATYQALSRFDPALKAISESLALFAKLSPPSPAEEAFASNVLGMIQLGAGQPYDAETNLRRAVSISTDVLGENHPETGSYQTNLALALIVEGQFERANVLLRRAKLITETRAGPADERLGLILAEMSASAMGDNKLSMAEEYARQAIAILSRQAEPDQTALAIARVNLSDVYLRARRLEEAEAVLPDAIATERRVAPGTRLLADGLRRLADLRSLQHAWPAAIELYKETIGLYENRLGPNSPVLAAALKGYAEALRHSGGTKAEVRGIESRAKAVMGFQPRT